MIIRYKEPKFREQFLSRDVTLRMICLDFALFSVRAFGITPVVTRVTDVVEGESGVHPQGRAVDFRDDSSDGKSLYSDEQAQALVDFLNDRYQRRGIYPTCYYHGENKHFHIQIPPDPEDYVFPENLRIAAEGFKLAEETYYRASPLICPDCTGKLELYKKSI